MIKIIEPKVFADERGVFTKFECPFNSGESFYSTNKPDVLRGMHYQKDTAKFVYCSKGAIIDVWLELKTGKWDWILLQNKGIYIPEGYAHGFYSINESEVHYMQSKPYNKEDEGGILWNSFGFSISDPILSERDKGHPTYDIYRSANL